MKTASLASLLCVLLTPAFAWAQESNPNLHDGIRRVSVDAFGLAMYSPNTASVAGAGARGSYQIGRNVDVEGAIAWLHTFAAPGQAPTQGVLLEGGAAVSGGLGNPHARFGGWATVGAAVNGDTTALAFGFGPELRVGTACAHGSPFGLDARLRLGLRLFQGLAAEFPADAVYGAELAVGFGWGGPRLIATVTPSLRSRSVDAVMALLGNDLADVNTPVGRTHAPVCPVNTVVEAAPTLLTGADDGHGCTLSTLAANTPMRDGTRGCTLYVVTSPDDRGDRLAFGLLEGDATAARGFALTSGSAGMFVCDASTTWQQVRVTQTSADTTVRPVLTRVALAAPEGLTLPEATTVTSAAMAQGTSLLVVPDADTAVAITANDTDVQACARAPEVPSLTVRFPGSEDGQSLRWQATQCATLASAATARTLTLRRATQGDAPTTARWPVLITVTAR